jgi:hypothetical protein
LKLLLWNAVIIWKHLYVWNCIFHYEHNKIKDEKLPWYFFSGIMPQVVFGGTMMLTILLHKNRLKHVTSYISIIIVVLVYWY